MPKKNEKKAATDKASERVVEDGKEGIQRTKELLGRLLKVPKSAIPPKK